MLNYEKSQTAKQNSATRNHVQGTFTKKLNIYYIYIQNQHAKTVCELQAKRIYFQQSRYAWYIKFDYKGIQLFGSKFSFQ